MKRHLMLAAFALGCATSSARADIEVPDLGAVVYFKGHDIILIQAHINGQGPYTICFDTGANSVISTDLAKDLGLTDGLSKNYSTFGGSVKVASARLNRLQVGGMVVTDLPVAVTRLPYALTHMRPQPIVALIGEDLLPYLTIRIDSIAHTITFADPAKLTLPPGAPSTPLQRGPNGYSISGHLGRDAARFHIDTGQALPLMLFSGVVRSRNLIERYHPKAGGVSGQGIGGRERGWFARTPSIELGGVTVRNLVTNLSEDSEGIAAGEDTGNIGMGLFKRFTVTLDASRGRAFFEPNASFKRLDVFNRAGVRFEGQPDGAHIVMLFPAGPAAKAGLRAGDIVLSADGHTPEEGESFDDVFTQRSGTKVKLAVRGHNEPVQIVLADVL